MLKYGLLILLIALCGTSLCTITSYLSKNSQNGLLRSAITNLKQSQQLSDAFYVTYLVDSMRDVGKPTVDLCAIVAKTHSTKADRISFEESFKAAWISEKMQCKNMPLKDDVVKEATDYVKKTAIENLSEVYYATEIIKQKRPQFDNVEQLVQSVQKYLKTNGSLLNYGLAFHIASNLGENDAGAISAHIPKVLSHIDQMRNEDNFAWLQYEGGLSVTSIVVTGMLKLAKSPAPLRQHQADLLANYLYTRRSVATAKGAYHLINMAMALVNTAGISPIVVTATNAARMDSRKLRVKVCDFFGNEIRNAKSSTVVAESIRKASASSAPLFTKLAFKMSAEDGTIFDLNLESPLERGQYSILVSVNNQNSASINVIVSRKLEVDRLQLDISLQDEQSAGSTMTLKYPQKLQHGLKGDLENRWVVKLKLPFGPLKQAFLRFDATSNPLGGFSIALPYNANGEYILETTVKGLLKDYNIRLRNYELRVILGDSDISNPLNWPVGSVEFSSVLGGQRDDTYRPLLEIKHMFRAAEKRPPAFVSALFTGLCLLPLLVLLVLWSRLGANLKGLKLNWYTIVFHGSLAAILILFVVFWLKLNMFTTCKYLSGLVVTILFSGNRLLKTIN